MVFIYIIDWFANRNLWIFHGFSGRKEGTVSQIFYLAPIFDFVKSRKTCFKKSQKVTVFYHKIKPGPK